MKKVLLLCIILAVTVLCITSCELLHTHSFGEWEVKKPATCKADGERARYCPCGEKQTEVVYATGHILTNGKCENCDFKYSTGLEYISNGDGTCYVSGIGFCTDTEIVIPEFSPDGDRVTSIGEVAFLRCTSFTSIVIPNSVTIIDEAAFQSCDSLTSIVIPDSVTVVGDYAFSLCESLTSVVIGDSVTTICNFAFHECNSLTSVAVGKSVTTIGAHAFSYCRSLASIVIPDSVTYIGEEALEGCKRLASITVDVANEYYQSIDGNLFTKDGKKLIQYAIGKFNKKFIIPNSVTTIGNSAFSWCESLTTMVIPDSVTTIGAHAFSYCRSLASIVIPDSVTTIGASAFGWCDITSIVIPADVITIGDFAFSNCHSLTSVIVPSSVTTIGARAFSYCSGLTSISVDDANEYYQSIEGNLFTKDGKELIQYATGKSNTKFIIPDGVTTIGDFAFDCCDSITSVIIPDSVTSIGLMAFGNCHSLTDAYYKGSEEQWAEISIDNVNEYLTDATIHFNYVPEE